LTGAYPPVRKLAALDRVDGFDCGEAELKQFLQRYALVNQKANSAQTYVCCQGDVVAGFYSPTDPYHLFLILKDLEGMLS
jgi:hypothetical protein